MTISYVVGNSLYLNITNRCPNRCEFCVRNYKQSVGDADSLWLDHEPDMDEIISDLEKRDFSKYESVVFCGYGEPAMRLDDIKKISQWIKSKTDIPIRINTNGLSDLIYNRDTAPEFKGIVDVISISLNSSTPEGYDEICHSDYGLDALPAILKFASNVKNYVPSVILSVVDTIGKDEIEKCRKLAEKAGVKFRVREYIK